MTDYAIVQTGGKQYRANPGDTLRVERLTGDVGDAVELDDVVLFCRDGDVMLGKPTVLGARVKAEIIDQGRGKKIIVFKYKAKTRYRKKQGHRQLYTDIRITEISLDRRRTRGRKVDGS